jgi:hypothetical protein
MQHEQKLRQPSKRLNVLAINSTGSYPMVSYVMCSPFKGRPPATVGQIKFVQLGVIQRQGGVLVLLNQLLLLTVNYGL